MPDDIMTATILAAMEQQRLAEAEAAAQMQRRKVSVPNYSLGGRRMEGARQMTVQEQTMLEDPLRQMGRDAGSVATHAVNAAGFGIPGLVLRNTAPDLHEALRRNEEAANGFTAPIGTATGIAVAPAGAVAKMADLLRAAPRATATGAGILGLTAGSSEAGDTKTARDYQPPGIGEELIRTLMETVGKSMGEDRPMTADEFKASRRTIEPKTMEAILAEEKAKVKDDPTYTYGPRQRAALEAKAEQTAQKRFEASKGDLGEQEKRLDASYADYRKGWDAQRAEHLNKAFVDRHPGLAMSMTVGGPIASALMARGVFGAINSKGNDIVNKGLAAREADNVRALADQITRADNYVWRSNVGKGIAAAEAAAIPAELRMMQDVIDKKGLPADSGARKAAEARMSNVPEYAKGMSWDLISGLIGTGTGALWSKMAAPFPGHDLATLRDMATKAERKLPPDEMAIPLAERALRARDAESGLRAERYSNGGGNPASPSQPPQGPTGGTPAASSAPQGSSGGTALTVPPGGPNRPPLPGGASNQPTLPKGLEEWLDNVRTDVNGVMYWGPGGHGAAKGGHKVPKEWVDIIRQLQDMRGKPSRP